MELEIIDKKVYHFKNDLAYTWDNVLIYNVFAHNIPMETTQLETLKYFSNFGEVKSVHLFTDKPDADSSSSKIAFINYTYASSAASILKYLGAHLLRTKRISVMACDSWQQPLFPQSGDGGSNTDKQQKSKPFDITMLNNDCLQHIFEALEFQEQLRLALTCQRLRNAFEILCKTQHKNFRVENLEQLSEMEIREFFLIAGVHIDLLRGAVPKKCDYRTVEFIVKSCPNLKSINFLLTVINTSSLFQVMSKIKNCTVLKLRSCSLEDSAINALKVLPHLQSLSVANNIKLSGKYMHQLTGLIDLNLYGCENIVPKYFVAVVKSLVELKSLDIQLCECLKTFPLSLMVDYFRQLESLKICSIGPYDCIARLPKLKKLDIHWFPRGHSQVFISIKVYLEQLFKALVEHKSASLESLRIVGVHYMTINAARQISRFKNLKHFTCPNNENLTDECLYMLATLEELEEVVLKNCRSITNGGLLHLVRRCTKLKKVNIQYCTRITYHFVRRVIQILQSTESQRGNEPCLFYVAMSGISGAVRNDMNCVNANGMLNLSYYIPAPLGIKADEYAIFDDNDYDPLFTQNDRFDSFDDAHEMLGTGLW